jgi:hypothetical protein
MKGVKFNVGSLRTLQEGKTADARRRQLEGILRHAKNKITDALAANGFEVRADWIEHDEHQDLIFEDIEVGCGAVCVRREPAGSFAVRHFLEDGEQNPLDWDRMFPDLDSFVKDIQIWIHDLAIPCLECNGTGKRTLDGTLHKCRTCDGVGEISRDCLP